jgi:hypothetical protein
MMKLQLHSALDFHHGLSAVLYFAAKLYVGRALSEHVAKALPVGYRDRLATGSHTAVHMWTSRRRRSGAPSRLS